MDEPMCPGVTVSNKTFLDNMTCNGLIFYGLSPQKSISLPTGFTKRQWT